MSTLRTYFVITEGDTREQALGKCVAELKGLDLKMDTLKVTIEHKRPTMADYRNELNIISKWQGYHIQLSITLMEYALLQNGYRDYVESMKHGTANNR